MRNRANETQPADAAGFPLGGCDYRLCSAIVFKVPVTLHHLALIVVETLGPDGPPEVQRKQDGSRILVV